MSGDELVYEVAIDATPEKVWRALSVPELRAAWLLPEKDGRLDGRQEGLSGDIEAEVLDADAPRRMRLGWRESEQGERIVSVVTFELEDASQGGTILRLTHSNLTPVLNPANENAPVMMARAA